MSVVVGYVPKPQGEAALRVAAREARARDDTLHVVNWASGENRLDASFASDADLAAARAVVEGEGARYEVVQAVGHDGAEGVLDTARRTGAGLVVIGLRQRTAAGKFFFGSNAQRILMEAPCPVMTVRTDSERP